MRRLPGPQGVLVPMGLALLGLWLNAAVAFADGPGVPSVGVPTHVVSTVAQATQAAKSAPSTAHAAVSPATTTAPAGSAITNTAATTRQTTSQAATTVASTTTTTVQKASSAVGAAAGASPSPASDPHHKMSDSPKPPKPVEKATESVAAAAAPLVKQTEPVVSATQPVVSATEPIVSTAEPLIAEAARPVDTAVAPVVEQLVPVDETLDQVIAPVESIVDAADEPLEPLMDAEQQPPLVVLQPIIEATAAAAPARDSTIPTQSDASDDTPSAKPADPADDPANGDAAPVEIIEDAPLTVTNNPRSWIELSTPGAPSGDSASIPEAEASTSAPLRATTTATQATSLPPADVVPTVSEGSVAGAPSSRPPSNLVFLDPRATAEFGELSQPLTPVPTGQNRFGGPGISGGDALSLAMPLALNALGPPAAPSSTGSGPPPPWQETPTGPPELPASAASGALVSGMGGAGAFVLVATSLVLAAAWRTLWQVARLRPVGISLPNLAPPG